MRRRPVGARVHHPAVGRKVLIHFLDLGHPCLAAGLVYGLQAVGCGFVGTEKTEVGRSHVLAHHLAQELAQHARGLGLVIARGFHFLGEVAEVRHLQWLEQQTAIGMRIGTHATAPRRRQGGKFIEELAVLIE